MTDGTNFSFIGKLELFLVNQFFVEPLNTIRRGIFVLGIYYGSYYCRKHFQIVVLHLTEPFDAGRHTAAEVLTSSRTVAVTPLLAVSDFFNFNWFGECCTLSVTEVLLPAAV